MSDMLAGPATISTCHTCQAEAFSRAELVAERAANLFLTTVAVGSRNGIGRQRGPSRRMTSVCNRFAASQFAGQGGFVFDQRDGNPLSNRENLLATIAELRVRIRPGWQEPRDLKRRPEQYKLMQKPRNANRNRYATTA